MKYIAIKVGDGSKFVISTDKISVIGVYEETIIFEVPSMGEDQTFSIVFDEEKPALELYNEILLFLASDQTIFITY